MAADNSVRSVGRTFDLLAVFDAAHPFPTLRELVERSGLPKTTVVRLLSTLEQRGLVSAREDGRYSLGPGFLPWVRVAEFLWDVNDATRRVMQGLVDDIGETVNVYVRQGVTRMSIAQQEGTHTVRNVIEVGRPMPLWGGSASTVLLSAAPGMVEEVAAIGKADAAALRGRIEAAEKAGHSVSVGERELGATAISAPIRNAEGRLLAALSMSGPSSRFTDDLLERGISAITDAAKTISTVGLGSVEALL